jgi:hypothetical protein
MKVVVVVVVVMRMQFCYRPAVAQRVLRFLDNGTGWW